MRVMLRATMDTEKANELIRKGKLPQLMQETMDRLKPEAAYFTNHEGSRACYMVFDLQDSSQIPVIAEPFFMSLGAKFEIAPVMNAEDLHKGLSQLG
ncbi:DUF3303 family protein [Streptomyces rhizosphaerihabitans]|uniref:DUF3303 family protein n=1 Tax=Streptomyces rhizosphaerihabitans TaxID=1266770 RepID=UPI0021BFE760|nr:DUF3303 family protein [Streptomyces rhizosphaerihabitans]MCT9008395.1 hypothetical protein [Streptomyces rhizosphaerihabitans]